MKRLDEKGFVFLDEASRPYHVRMWEGQPWLFYWHPNKEWVSLRTLSQMDVWIFAATRLPDEQAALYFPDAEKDRLIAREKVGP
ncbi:hypothetical protein LCGC14_2437680 [marine sediment metagenome]|uniref:Uncharacterized protein n=1 Tax=marine sediment metagenome TaxID=412755 RepID=A0A0F9DWZ6_9ZZZZ